MKALILAAGYGTRLRPYTEHTPKALFPFIGRPLLEKIIQDLIRAGCGEILVNTHHLAQRIEQHIAGRNYPITVQTCHEPQILGTGGAIKKAAAIFGDQPFMVINSYIVTDIDLADVYRFHTAHNHPATLVLLNHPAFNTVQVDSSGFVLGFKGSGSQNGSSRDSTLTFTGIQVLESPCPEFIPTGTFSSIITAYEEMLASGIRIKAYTADSCRWNDLGTPERYTAAVIDEMAVKAFKKAFPGEPADTIRHSRLKGDGSDRKWYRLAAGRRSLIMVDHGIREKYGVCEADAFVNIGHHLHAKGISVPKIIVHDTFSGVVFLEDLGDTHFQDFVKANAGRESVVSAYRRIINELIRMSIAGAEGFDPAWTCQTAAYTKDFILNYECRYFVESFLAGYLGMRLRFEDFAEEFTALADGAVNCSLNGFMHRDFQSRNIMVKDHRYYLIDFQGGRMGPLQYDLASLLIDPYVALAAEIRADLMDYCMKKLHEKMVLDEERFRTGFQYCSLTRNLQILGAFGFLSRVKGKTGFEQYIPVALKTLKDQLKGFDTGELRLLKRTVDEL